MSVTRQVVDGKLEIFTTGAIFRDHGSIRGINPSGTIVVGSREISGTLVKYGGVDPPSGEFMFYGQLPQDIEGMSFTLIERFYSGRAGGIPDEQSLSVYEMKTDGRTGEFNFRK